MEKTKVIDVFDGIEQMPSVVKLGKRIILSDSIIEVLSKLNFPVNGKFNLTQILQKVQPETATELEAYLDATENRTNRCASFTLVLRQRANLRNVPLAFSSVSGKIYVGRKRSK